MRDGYVEVPVTSRAAQSELERQQARRRAARGSGLDETSPALDANSQPQETEAGPERLDDTPTPLDS